MKNYEILIIDDQVDIINTIIDVLEAENTNYTFYHALGGIQGIEVAKKYLPDLILTDWEMPDLCGIETIRHLKEDDITKDIPVIMVTGIMTSSDNLKTALSAGAIDYIRKPIDPVELTSRIKSMLMLADSYKEIIEVKNRELAFTTMNIFKNNEFNQKLIKTLKDINIAFGIKNRKLERNINDIVGDITSKIRNEAFDQFNACFNNVHPDFFKSLSTEFPELTPAEFKLAAFLKLNLSTKEISDILFITPGSIKTARNRLRAKLKLAPEENLVSFLMKF